MVDLRLALALGLLCCCSALPLESMKKNSGTGCISESGDPVDWWFTYKLPHGYNFAYKDSSDTSTGPIQISNETLNRTTAGALGATLHQVYKDKTGMAYVIYNDEPVPDSADTVTVDATGGAHAKGVLAFDGDSGFWLVHSVPKFPDLNAPSFEFPDSGTIYGQTFLCLSLNADGVDSAALQMRYDHVDIFKSNLPSDMESSVPNMKQLLDKEVLEGTHVWNGQTVSGADFTSFAKSNDWGKDLGEDLVSPTLGLGFMWETWRRGGALPSYCPPDQAYASINIMSMNFTAEENWSYTHDHAKWGISTTEEGATVCVGDINRMTSQRKRGGGTVCMKNSALYAAMRPVVGDLERTC